LCTQQLRLWRLSKSTSVADTARRSHGAHRRTLVILQSNTAGSWATWGRLLTCLYRSHDGIYMDDRHSACGSRRGFTLVPSGPRPALVAFPRAPGPRLVAICLGEASVGKAGPCGGIYPVAWRGRPLRASAAMSLLSAASPPRLACLRHGLRSFQLRAGLSIA
jgi:hypothetical protein